jgi:hypothetical protein
MFIFLQFMKTFEFMCELKWLRNHHKYVPMELGQLEKEVKKKRLFFLKFVPISAFLQVLKVLKEIVKSLAGGGQLFDWPLCCPRIVWCCWVELPNHQGIIYSTLIY